MHGDQSCRAGFTLIEILVVVIIIGILASVAGVSYSHKADDGKRVATYATIESIKTAASLFELQIGRFPASIQEIIDEGNKPGHDLYLQDETPPKDGWGNELRYAIDGKRIRVRSAGKDGVFENDDDIVK